MYGVFFEDINFSADGGIYAELVQNRSFEFSDPLAGWQAAGRFEVRDDGPFERAPHYMRLLPSGHREKHTALLSEGFFGISLKAGGEYRFSVWARAPFGGRGRLKIELGDATGGRSRQVLTGESIIVEKADWQRYELTLTAPEDAPKAALRVFLRDSVAVDVEHVSLFPADTWKGRPGGLRRDLVEALAELHPGVLRFPGGCIVEGTEMPDRYQWKNTVGPVENRPVIPNRWQYTFKDHFFPDYFQSGGLGFYEYFCLAEDLGAEPLPVINCGMVCQYQNGPDAHCPVDELDTFVQDALDLVEFANGDASTTWGAVRASMGHPEPFALQFLAVGNEQWGPEYVERLQVFVKALRAAHPEIRIVGSSGPDPEGERFDWLWPQMASLGADLVDEHYYRNAEWFLSQAGRYDGYDRRGPAVFAGEYACHVAGRSRNCFEAALCEAAVMTGFERNADVVQMATYAPLFARADAWQWRPDLIWFDNDRVLRTSSYYVQQLYMKYKGARVLPTGVAGEAGTSGAAGKSITGGAADGSAAAAGLSPLTGQDGLYASAVLDGESVYVKVVNASDSDRPLSVSFDGLKKPRAGKKASAGRDFADGLMHGVEIISMHADDPAADNSFEHPAAVVPVSSELDFSGTAYSGVIPARTFEVLVFRR